MSRKTTTRGSAVESQPVMGKQTALPGLDAGTEKPSPPLKWAGGKRRLVPTLRAIWSPHSSRRLVEPFAGGLSVSLGLSPRRAVINDINKPLINFYRWLKRGLVVEIPLKYDKELYYEHRERFNHLIANSDDDTAEAAALFYYLNRTGFNGLCRFNKRGEFNVPFGSYKTINYVMDFAGYRETFADWKFENVDVEELLVEPSDFIYADPPFDVEFTKYSKEDFDWEDQVRSAKWLASHPGPVVLSNQATPRIIELYERLGFELRYLDARRSISCNGDRTPAREVLATKNL